MIRLLNSMNYDAWVVGNHEFDWGSDPMVNVIKASIIKEIAGFRIGIIGTITPPPLLAGSTPSR